MSIVVLLQLSLRYNNQRIYHDQLSVNGGKTTNLLKPSRTHKTLIVAQERFVFLYLFFKSKGPLALVLQCFLSYRFRLREPEARKPSRPSREVTH